LTPFIVIVFFGVLGGVLDMCDLLFFVSIDLALNFFYFLSFLWLEVDVVFYFG
jgi:hypothetical protein